MKRAFTFRLRPTVNQAQALAECLEAHRELYNAALSERRDAYRTCGVTVTYAMQSAQLKGIRRVREDQARWSFQSAGHPAPPQSCVRGVLPPGHGRVETRLPEIQGGGLV